MNKNKHLVRSDRDTIKSMLDENVTLLRLLRPLAKIELPFHAKSEIVRSLSEKMLNTPFTMPASIGFHVRKNAFAVHVNVAAEFTR